MSLLPPTSTPLGERFPALSGSVFVVTYGRSGSTLIQNLLNGLPGYVIRGENENLVAQLARAWDSVISSEQRAKMFDLGKVTDRTDPWFGYEAVAADELGAALAAGFAETVLRPGPETRITGFKEIRWHADPMLFPVSLEFLRNFFPSARFIFNTRDHEQVIRSGWWKRMKPENVKRQLSQAEALYRDYAGRNPSICLEVNYTTLVGGADAWRPVFEFLDEPFDRALVQGVLDTRLTHLQNA